MKKKKLIALLLAASLTFGNAAFGSGYAYAAENTNLALGKTATASSFEVAGTNASKAVDGDVNTHWGTAQNKAANEYLVVDLGTPTEIRQINVHFEREDANQNILDFKVEVEENGTYTQVYRKQEKAKQIEKIILDQAKTVSKVKVTILNANGGTIGWVNAGIAELEVYKDVVEDIEATENVNHVRTATMSASNVEDNLERLNAAKAGDGDANTRWASNYDAPGTQWLKAEFTKLTKVKEIRIKLLNRNVPAANSNSNVEQFSIKYTNKDGQEVYAVQNFENEALATGWATEVSVKLDTPIEARDIKLCDFVANSASWNNISVEELEAYSNEYDESAVITLDSVVESIQGQTIAKDVNELTIPTVPEGYTVKFNGADFEQLIAENESTHKIDVFHPLTDKTVQVAFEVTETESGDKKMTADLPFVVKGKYTQAEDKNEKPVVIPEIAEWYTDSTASLSIASLTKVVYSDDALEAVVDEFIADYKDFTGKTLTKKKGAAEANAYNFVKQAPDAMLGEEGYTMDISSDRVIVKSESTTGNMYGMQTILQMYKQNQETMAIGSMRDYPRFPVRGFLFDVARKPISMEMIKEVSRTMRYYKMNDFQVHLSDNYIFLENYFGATIDDEMKAFQAYDAFRLESGLTNDKGESPTADDYSISKKDFREFIQSERALGMNIVPEIDVPAHANSFTKVWPELMVVGRTGLNAKRPLIDHLDVAKEETRAKIKEIFDDYTKGTNPTFDSETTVHIGADEFVASAKAYRDFVNDLVPYVKETNTVRMWGGLTWIRDNPLTPIIPEAIENVEMNLWSKDWADGMDMYDMGFKLINTIDTYGYMVPDGNKGRGAYQDLLNVNSIFNDFAPERVSTKSGWKKIPSGDEQALGAAFAIWSDNIDKHASGLSESDLYWRFFDAMPFYAEKTWAANGKEKGTANALKELAQEQGTGPRTNPYYQEDKVGEDYESYDFEDGLADTTDNNRDLKAGTANVEDGALKLTGSDSYVTSPIDVLGNDNQLSFDITLQKPAKPGQIIFETDAAYGTHDIRIMEDGNLGFTRELYNYYFDYKLPVGKKINVEIVAEQQKTTLYVDGEKIGTATGKFIHRDIEKKVGITNATFALPVERIGSKTNAVTALIDNVVVSEKKAAAADAFNKAAWTGETNSETVSDATEGLLRYAFDNKMNTIWHSNWKGVEDKLVDGKTYYAEIDFKQAYEINQFSFTPRTPQASGRVTKADLFIKEKASDDWKQVAADAVFENNANKKTFTFDAQKVQFVKFVAKESNDGWVAVSEFDIAQPAMATVYVEAEEGGTVTGGTEVREGTEVTVTATPETGYRFTGWYDIFGEQVSDEASYTFEVTENIALTAKFEEDGTVVPKPEYTVTIDGKAYKVKEGERLPAITNPSKAGHRFDGFFEAGSNTAADLTAPVTKNMTLTSRFTAYTVTAADSENGTVTVSKMNAEGKVTVTATAKEGYSFTAWMVDGKEVSTDTAYTFVPSKDTVVTAVFEKDTVVDPEPEPEPEEPKPPVVKPVDEKKDVTENSIKISWNASVKATGYRIYVDGKMVKELDADVTSYSLEGLKAATEYKIVVAAFNAQGETTANQITVTTKAQTPTEPTKPTKPTDPDDGKTPDSGKQPSGKPSPETADMTSASGIILLLGFAAAVIAVITKKRYRKDI